MFYKEDPNYIYYNIRINGDTTEDIQADYSVDKTVEILNNPKEYEMSVVRFKIPADSIPIFFFEDNKWSLLIERNGVETDSFFLLFVQNTNGTPIYGKRGIWTPQEFVNSTNEALKQAYLDSGLTDDPPFIVFDPVSNLMSIYKAESEDYKIFFSKTLYDKYVSFPTASYDTSDIFKTAEIQTVNNYGQNIIQYNGKAYTKTTQDYISVNKWSMVQQILFRTTLLPVNPELEGNITNVTRDIITDFEPIEAPFDKSSYYYFGRGALRYIDLLSEQELRSIDLSVYWRDTGNNEYKFILNSLTPLTIKLLFRKKLKYQYQ
jgi:hypothetical protein